MSEGGATPTERPLHFLVVDDDAESRATVVEILRSFGHDRITQARDGSEAARAIERDPSINFVISDWEMPFVNGLSLLQRVRSSPARANLPFLIMTSPVSAEAEKIILAAESYVDAYVIKPFRAQTLRDKIEDALRLSVHGPQKPVLVVDDDDDARAMIVEYVRQLGFREVQALAEGRSALELLRADPDRFGLIISDWEMPEMSGLDLLKSCKEHPRLADIPFLMVTSQGSMERMKVMQAARAQVDQYLLKPFAGAELKKRIDQLLERARNRHEVQSLLTEAAAHAEQGRVERAQVQYEAVLRLDPANDSALRGLGDVFARVKGMEAAIPYYKRAIEANPLSARAYVRLAGAYERVGLGEKAAALLQTGIRQVGFSAALHFALGRLYHQRGQLTEARAEFSRTLELELEHPEARLMLDLLKGDEEG